MLPDDGTLIVRKGKGAKDRLSAFNRDTSATLLHYIERRRDVVRGKPDHGALFVSENGRGLTGDAVGAVVTRRARLAGVGSVSAHELKHLFADQLKRAGASDETLMSLGGWADQKIVGRYGRSLRRERALEEQCSSRSLSRPQGVGSRHGPPCLPEDTREFQLTFANEEACARYLRPSRRDLGPHRPGAVGRASGAVCCIRPRQDLLRCQ